MKHKCKGHKNLKRRLSTSWAMMPLPALTEVMRFLNDEERVSCAKVCRHWQDAFHSPMLWRERSFEFGGSRFRPLGQKALPYALKLGRHLQHLTITCNQLTSHTCESMVRCLELFLEALMTHGPPELRSFNVEGLELEFWRFGILRELVTDILSRFLRSQNKLKTFSAPRAQFGLLPGVGVLESLAEGNGCIVEELFIEFFFKCRQPVLHLDRFHTSIQSFTNLRRVAINYCCLSDELITTWADTLSGKLEYLRVRAYDNEPYGHVISNAAWSKLTSSCPKLTVELSIFGFGHSRDVLPILAPPIPVKSFNFFSGYDMGTELQLSSIISHVTSCYHQSLRHLDLELDNYHDNVDDALVLAVTRCRHLSSLRIKAQASLEVPRFVCRWLEEGRSNLAHVDLMLCELTPMEVEHLTDLRDDMAQVVEELGVELFLRDDLYS